MTLELEPHHAEVARNNLETGRAVRAWSTCASGRRSKSLAALSAEGAAPFDFIFIDADKPNNPHYLSWAVRLSRPGTVIVCDNVIRDGAVLERGR